MASKKEVEELLKQRLSELGKKGGLSLAKSLTKAERVEKAKKAAAARWGKKKPAKAE